jgi:hypothetical protein
MRETGGIKSLPPPSTPPSGSSQEAGTNISAASLLAKYTQLPYAESGDIATDASTSYISVSQDGSTLNVSSANYIPGMDVTRMPDIVILPSGNDVDFSLVCICNKVNIFTGTKSNSFMRLSFPEADKF